MVSRLVWDQDAEGSIPSTPTMPTVGDSSGRRDTEGGCSPEGEYTTTGAFASVKEYSQGQPQHILHVVERSGLQSREMGFDSSGGCVGIV